MERPDTKTLSGYRQNDQDQLQGRDLSQECEDTSCNDDMGLQLSFGNHLPKPKWS